MDLFAGFARRWAEYQASRERRAAERSEHAEIAATQEAAHHTRIGTAATVSTLELVCHIDTWNTLDRFAGIYVGWPHDLESSGRISKPDANHVVTVSLSGPQVVTLLHATYRLATRAQTGASCDVPVASTYYSAISKVLDGISEQPLPDASPPRLVFDARPAPAPHGSATEQRQ